LKARARNTLFGLVALALFVGAVALTWFFLKGGFQGGHPVDAVFSQPGVGQQLPINGDVKIRGVLVGVIVDIDLDDEGRAVVTFNLDGDVDIPADSTAEIRSKTVFGQKWVELIPPANPTTSETLAEVGVIPDSRTVEPLELERALQLGHDLLSEVPLADLTEVFSTLADGFSGQEDDVRKAIDKGLIALRAVNSRSDKFDLSLRQLNEFSAWLDQNDETLLSFMSSLDLANRALLDAESEFVSNLQSVPTFFNDAASFQESVNADLGRLVEEGATLAEILARRSDDLRLLIVDLEPFTTVWNSGLKQPCGGLFEQNMTCWQVYQVPGLDSRGIYGDGQGPDEDDPGDPNFGRTVSTVAGDEELDVISGLQPRHRSVLARLLLGPDSDLLLQGTAPEETSR
jgi:phospholipid/cholesterol/gamma-HCH transport system substrate-binding protein